MKNNQETPWEMLAEKLIVEAQKRGEFDNLPGLGKPITDSYLNTPWIANWMQRNNLTLDMEQAQSLIKLLKDG